MSLETYRQTLNEKYANERKRQSAYSNPPIYKNKEDYDNYEYHAQKHKSHTALIIFGSIVIALLFLAVITNPSRTEIKNEVNSLIVDKFKSSMQEQALNDENGAMKQIFSGLAAVFAPTIIENTIDTDVNNYIIFSTFNSKITLDDQQNSLISGIVVFGDVIPLKSDFSGKLNKATE